MGLVLIFAVMYLTPLSVAQVDEDATMWMNLVPTSAPPTENSMIHGAETLTDAISSPPAVTPIFSETFPTSEASTETQTIYEPPVPSLHLKSSWQDVFPFESAEFVCSVNDSSNWTFSWYRNGQPLQDKAKIVQSSSQQAELTISGTSPAHAGMYSCRAHHSIKGETTNSDPIELKVFANKPQPMLALHPKLQKMFPGESVTFHCIMNMSFGWDYQWYHNGTEIQGSHNNSFTIISLALSNSGRYHCKAKRGQIPFYTEPSETSTLQVSEPPTPTMELRTSWLDVFQMENVELTCDVGSPDWTFTWHRNGMELQEDSGLVLSLGGSLLNITSASQAHQGRYTCKAHLKSRKVSSAFSNNKHVTVYENIPKPSLSKDHVFSPMYVGDDVTFTCKVDVGSDWVYHWFKDGKELAATVNNLGIHLRPHNGGTYWCKATRGQRTSTDFSNTQDVYEIPLPSMTRNTQWADVFPTERVTFSCAMTEGSGWTYTWRRDNQVITRDDTVSFGPNGATLSINSALHSHQGQYSCSGKLKGRSVSSNFTSGMNLSVYEKKPTAKLVQDPEHMIMHTDDSVSYSCRINQSFGWDYVWYKDDTQLKVSGKNYTIRSLVKSNSGSYTCQAVRGRSTSVLKSEQSPVSRLQVEERPSANIIVLTGWSEVFSTDSLVLKCDVKGSADMWNYTWFIEGREIMNSSLDKYTVTPQNDPAQSQYICQGIRSGRPSYSKGSNPLTTRNLLLKRRVLLSISGCILFGIVAVFFGCVVLRVTRKKEDYEDGPEEGELFLTMAQLKDRDEAPCPLVDYITDAELSVPVKEGAEIICSEATPLPITSQDDQVVTTVSSERPPAEEGTLISFQR